MTNHLTKETLKEMKEDNKKNKKTYEKQIEKNILKYENYEEIATDMFFLNLINYFSDSIYNKNLKKDIEKIINKHYWKIARTKLKEVK